MGRRISPFIPRAKHTQPILLDKFLDRLDFTATYKRSFRIVSSFSSKWFLSVFWRICSLFLPSSEQFKDLFGFIGGALASGSLVRVDVIVRTIPLARILAGIVILMTRYRIVR